MKSLRMLVLPSEVTNFEQAYVHRLNRIGLRLYWLHVPFFILLAAFNDTDPVLAAVLTPAILAGPTVAFFTMRNARWVGVIYGITAMMMGGLLVHFGQGPVQIEMHFYFFAMLAILAIYGNPMVVVAAAVTVALHHVLFWLFLPRSVFNYEAPWWVVAVHAGFVVAESAVTTSMARSFFDNVIGLEKIIRARTAELKERNAAMQVVMDHVQQGLLTLELDGRIGPEYSAAAGRWFSEPQPGEAFAEILAQFDPNCAALFEMGLEQLRDGLLPEALCLAQLPSRLSAKGLQLRMEYQAIHQEEELVRLLVVVTDITQEMELAATQREQQETLNVLEQILKDKEGFFEFCEEAESIVDAVESRDAPDLPVLRRLVHTLKGNASIFRIQTVAEACHELESHIDERGQWPEDEAVQALVQAWRRIKCNLDQLLDEDRAGKIEIDDAEFLGLLQAVLSDSPPQDLASRIARWKLESTDRRLERVAKQAQALAQRLDKGTLDIELQSNDLHLDPRRWAPFWASFAHAVRNAVDHGIESPSDRQASGKGPRGRLMLRTLQEGDRFIVEIQDDGRGVNWEAVRQKAERLKLSCGTAPEDLAAVLFRDGFSTRDQVSEHSGRGVGMSALRQATEQLGGSVEVDSKTGQGTRFRFTFPAEAMAPAPTHLLQELQVGVA